MRGETPAIYSPKKGMTMTEIDKKAEQGLQELHERYSAKAYPELDEVRRAVIDTAYVFVGVREIGDTNSGYWINRFLKRTGLGEGYPWCMAFVQFVISEACAMHGIPDLLKYDSASTRNVWEHYEKQHATVHALLSARPGDVFIQSSGKSWRGHTGIVIGIAEDTVCTIEGNTGGKSWRDGGGVEMKIQNVSKFRVDKPRDHGAWTRGYIDLSVLWGNK